METSFASDVTFCRAVNEIAAAKINLSLHVVGRREDGYHLLESLVAFTSLGDELYLERHTSLELKITGPFSGNLTSGDDNLILRAARAQGVNNLKVTLNKRLPVAAGLGGGSADAAAALRGMHVLGYGKQVSNSGELAMSLGADVPICLRSKACFMRGIGDQIEEVPDLPKVSILLVNPMIEVSTATVFKNLHLEIGEGVGGNHPSLPTRGWDSAHALSDYLLACRNDLEQPALSIAPDIGVLLALMRRLPGCLMARMSGSGATCFALFAEAGEAMLAEREILTVHPRWWTMSSQLS
ncbi:4-diphosphocytidyl-2-C-methyl-D-erythritol kinase [Rhodoligotrophos appendicifer]|uniref:4-(cytidine 5'-diphospho)-2-C-methyl-D-erythritol kinase n=1 Tax=Rhodoligotrophos appendicifer TaxID=987056 RepID=UPI0014792066|nr:4-(cytidine 5'-diphospho)-2-C-methyl-D-erythritol kinase [Rhodoligotrophos appendicifer]